VRSWRWVGPVMALALVVGLVAGCDGSSSGGGGSSGDGSGPPTTNSSDGGSSSDGGLAWVPFGPDDPDIPTPSWPAYKHFAQGNCSGLQAYFNTDDGRRVGDFGKAMVAVCAAAVEGRQDQWEVAARALAAGEASSLANDCLADEVKDLLERALAWHQRHPGRKPAVQLQEVGGKSGERKTDCGKNAPPTETEPTDTVPPTETEPTDTVPPTETEPTETTG
jgi:hypothetical protein